MRLTDLIRRDHRVKQLERDLAANRWPRIAGGAQEFLQVTANAALTTAQATVIGPLLAIPEDPLVLAFFYASNITGVAAAAAVTINLVRSDTSAVFSAGVFTNNGAGAGNVGGPDVLGIVPFGIPAANGVLAQAAVSSGTATIVGAATTPIVLGVLGLA